MLIKIIAGTFGLPKGGKIIPIKAGDDPINVKEDRARELIKMGVAEEAESAGEKEPTVDELKTMIEGLGMDVPKKAKKAELLAIVEEAEQDQEEEEEAGQADGPDLGNATDQVV